MDAKEKEVAAPATLEQQEEKRDVEALPLKLDWNINNLLRLAKKDAKKLQEAKIDKREVWLYLAYLMVDKEGAQSGEPRRYLQLILQDTTNKDDPVVITADAYLKRLEGKDKSSRMGQLRKVADQYPLAKLILYFESEYGYTAINYLRDAADAGLAPAEQHYAENIWKGEYGLSKDSTKVQKLYEHSAQQGYQQSQEALGVAFDPNFKTDAFVSQNEEKAIKWYKLSALQAAPRASWNISSIYNSKGEFITAAKYCRDAFLCYKTLKDQQDCSNRFTVLRDKIDDDCTIDPTERFKFYYFRYTTFADLDALFNFLSKNKNDELQKLFVKLVMQDVNSPNLQLVDIFKSKIYQFLDAHQNAAKDIIAIRHLNARMSEVALQDGDKKRALELALRFKPDEELDAKTHFHLGLVIYNSIDADKDNYETNFKILLVHFSKVAEDPEALPQLYKFLGKHPDEANPTLQKLIMHLARGAYKDGKGDLKKALSIALKSNPEFLEKADHEVMGKIIQAAIIQEAKTGIPIIKQLAARSARYLTPPQCLTYGISLYVAEEKHTQNFELIANLLTAVPAGKEEFKQVNQFLDDHQKDVGSVIHSLNVRFAEMALGQRNIPRTLELVKRTNLELLSAEEICNLGFIIRSQQFIRNGSRDPKYFVLMLDCYVLALKKGSERASKLLQQTYQEVFAGYSFTAKLEIKPEDKITGKDILDYMVKLQRDVNRSLAPTATGESATTGYLEKLTAEKEADKKIIVARIQLIDNINKTLGKLEGKLDPDTVSSGEVNKILNEYEPIQIKDYAKSGEAHKDDEKLLPAKFRPCFHDNFVPSVSSVTLDSYGSTLQGKR